jgi:phenylpropionate dioxygenase-like ring-hydroxylating dioxygenase large terminal subunit
MLPFELEETQAPDKLSTPVLKIMSVARSLLSPRVERPMNVQTSPPSAADPLELGTDPIPAKPYYDPGYFELERQAVFLRSWLNVGHVCELPEPGSFVRREIEFAKASLLIVRGKDGEVRTFYNTCTHRGTQIEGAACGKKATFSCPYHMWTFGTDGRLISAPDFERFHADKADLGLKEVATGVCAGLIFINFAKEPESLREFLGPMAEMLATMPVARATTFFEYVYDIDANWKLTYDNFQENYHLRFIHSRTAGAGVGADNPFGYPTSEALYGEHRTQTIWTNPNAAEQTSPTMATAFAKPMIRAARDGYLEHPYARDYFALFPNFFMLGTSVNHFLHTVFPIAADKSRGVIRIYCIGDDETAGVRYGREFAMATLRDVHAEDRGVIEAGQRGLASGALEHIHFQEKEVLCRHLFLTVDARVQAYEAQQEGRTA